MIRRFISILARRLKILVVLILSFSLIWVLVQGLIIPGYSIAWTGFGDFTRPDDKFVRGKTFWDWMQLFLVPIFLSAGVFLLNRTERISEREIAEDRQREAAFQSYLDRIADLLLKEDLRTTQNEEVRRVARLRTLAVLRQLDANRKGMVFRFLNESGLIGTTPQPIIPLEGADLRGVDLQGEMIHNSWLHVTDLRNANLSYARLMGVELGYANLMGANLRGSWLHGANLSEAQLYKASLEGAVLKGANLSGAYLGGADLKSSDLTGAELTKANLRGASLVDADLTNANLQGAFLCNEQKILSVILPRIFSFFFRLSGEHVQADFWRLNEGAKSGIDLIDASLHGATLKGANLTNVMVTAKQLATVKSLEGAIMPDGTKHD